MIKRIIAFLRHQSFQPGLFAVVFNPFYFIRRSLYLEIKKLAPNLTGKLIDLGCGRKPYESLFSVREYIGVDIAQSGHDHRLSKIDVFYDGRKLPFPDETFDSLFCSEVLEHVFQPAETLDEIARVLKSGGKALITIPFSWNEHEVPYDYARYTSFGIKHLLETHGFRVTEMKKTGSFAQVVLQLSALYIYEVLKRFNKVGYVLSLFLIVPLNVIGLFILPIMPTNKTLFFNSVVLAEKN